MGLAERLKKKQCLVEERFVAGTWFVIRGQSLRGNSECFAKGRNKKTGAADTARTNAAFLAACVEEKDTGEKLTLEDWLEVPSHITGPLMTATTRVCGLDNDDVEGLTDPKDLADDQNCTSPTDSDD